MEQGLGTSERAGITGPLVRAVEYVRMSTDHQEYSTAIQSATNHAYAARRGMVIVRTYADEGKSGLRLDGRDAPKQLIGDVESGTADFTAILVYDVSRWGRFQDADESAHHEYICKRAGISVHYCAEQFENDGSLYSAIIKSIKRAMAGEYSRELSAKTFAGQLRLVECGFHPGAAPAYGTRRLLVDKSGVRKFILGPGEYKSIQTDRVVLILGPPEEVRIVRWIFSNFVKRKKPEQVIVKILNERGISSGLDRPWTYARVRKILQNEIYIGNSIWNRTSLKLGGNKIRNRPETWLRTKCSFAPIIARPQFEAAQTIIRDRGHHLSDDEMLAPLRQLLRKHGFLSTRLVDDSPDTPCLTSLHERFGGLGRIYKLIGFTGHPPGATYGLSNDELLAILRRLLRKRGRLSESIINHRKGVPCANTYQRRFGSLSRAYELIGYNAVPGSHQSSWTKTRALSNDQLLAALQNLLRKRGHLTRRMIDNSKNTPSSPTYRGRFGSLTRAYELIGYMPKQATSAQPVPNAPAI